MYSKTIQRELCLKPILHFALHLRFGAKTREKCEKKKCNWLAYSVIIETFSSVFLTLRNFLAIFSRFPCVFLYQHVGIKNGRKNGKNNKKTGGKIINLVVCRLNIYVGKERMLVFMSSSRLSWPKMRLPW